MIRLRNTKMDPVRIGEKLRKLRGIRTRVGVAKQVGIAPSALANYESGRRVPTDEAKILLSKYYAVPVQELFFDD